MEIQKQSETFPFRVAEVEPPHRATPEEIKGYKDQWYDEDEMSYTHTPDVYLPIDVLDHYKEYERHPDDDYVKALRDTIADQGGIREPLMLSLNDTHGNLFEGNHRLAAAKQLGIKELPVNIFYEGGEVNTIEGEPKPHHPGMLNWMSKHPDMDSFPESMSTHTWGAWGSSESQPTHTYGWPEP